jgi:hypothetical protein
MTALPAELATRIFASDRRMAERFDVVLWTRVRVPGKSEHPARIGNISASGFMAMTSCPVQDYAALEIELPKTGWVKATALWSMGDRIGGEFESLLHRDTMKILTEYALS